jgi:hypothetical protein
MARIGVDRPGLWRLDHALPAAGLGLVALGVTVWPPAQALAWAAFGLGFFGWVAEADGFALPRRGWVPIRTYGCWETPLAFTVRHRGTLWLFSRKEDPDRGGWSNEYVVRERADGAFLDPRSELPLAPGSGWSLRGRAPVVDLRFEHHERVSYVSRGSLESALARTDPVPRPLSAGAGG